MIGPSLTQKIGEAMKAHDSVRLSTLRMLSSEFNYEKINKQRDLTEEDELLVVRKEAKKRKESIEAYTNAGAADKAEAESKELAILQEFLPPDISDSDLEKIVDEAIAMVSAKTISDMGKIMAFVKPKAPSADGTKIAQLVRSKLSL